MLTVNKLKMVSLFPTHAHFRRQEILRDVGKGYIH